MTDRPLHVVQTVDTIIVSESHVVDAAEVGDNSAVEDWNATHAVALGAIGTPRGTGGAHDELEPLADESPVKSEEIVERFKRRTPSMKPSTQYSYVRWFLAFEDSVNLDGISVKELRNPKQLRDILLGYITSERDRKMSGRTVRTKLAGIQRVLQEGAEVDGWPLRKSDRPKTVPADGGHSPPDATMRLWGDAICKETDVHTRMVLLLLANYGFRSQDQLGELRRRDVELNDAGYPVAIVTKNPVELKTGSPIVAYIWPDVADAIRAFWQRYPGTPEDPLVPWCSSVLKPERLNLKRGINRQCVSNILEAVRDRYNLPRLVGRSFRKFVKKKCREAGWSFPARAKIMGHASQAPGVEGTYDNPEDADILAEQAQKMDRGPLGMVLSPTVKTVPDDVQELVALCIRLKDSKLKPSEFQDQLMALIQREAAKGVYVR